MHARQQEKLSSNLIQAMLKELPSVESLISNSTFETALRSYSRDFITYIIRKQIGNIRDEIRNGIYFRDVSKKSLSETIIKRVENYLAETDKGALLPVVNATGVVLHTGLGRAPLSPAAVSFVQQIISGYSTLEIDRSSGRRGSRTQILEELLCYLCWVETAMVVNNNAAAVMIVLNTLAHNKEVIISRGELVEIGGSFRMPDIMAASSVEMVEVGTTNKTKVSDYTKAVNKNTGAILKVHSSNYRVLGFSESAAISDLKSSNKCKNIPVIFDLGGGVIFDLERVGLPHEPIVAQSIRDGADIITFSGDKVFGGPQSGIIVGKKKYVDEIKKNPFARAMRCDKLILAALYGTILTYLKRIEGFTSLPSTKMLMEKPESIRKRALKVKESASEKRIRGLIISVEACESEVGSGAMPLERLPSFALCLASKKISAEYIAAQLRSGSPPIFSYIKNNKVYLDMRTVFRNQLKHIIENIAAIHNK